MLFALDGTAPNAPRHLELVATGFNGFDNAGGDFLVNIWLAFHGAFLCAPDKPASCMRMRVPLGEGRAAHAVLEYARLSASSAVKRYERKVQAWY
jgi:hypothetical protein